MTGFHQSPPETPHGVDLEVQSRIDALLARSSTADDAVEVFKKITNNDAVIPCSNATTTQSTCNTDTQTSNRRFSPSSESDAKYLRPVGNTNEDNDEGIWHERAPWIPSPLPYPQAVARFADPSKALPSPTSTSKTVIPILPPTHTFPILSIPPSLSTLFNHVVTYISSFFTASSNIIEYSDAEIQRKTRVCIEAQEWVALSTKAEDSIVRVVAIVTDISPIGKDEGVCEVIKRPMEIWAKQKRVREILRGEGCYITDEVYEREIRVALRRLRKV